MEQSSRPLKFAAFAWLTLAYNIGVVLWGAYVRATGSGAGCGEHWPLCNGEVVPRSPQAATIIEFTHRISSGVALILAVALVIAAWRVFPRRDPVRRAAGASLCFMILEGLIGAALVLLGHVGTNASISRAYSLTVHLINTLFLLASLALAAWLAPRKDRVAAPPPRWGGALTVAILSVLVIGVSGVIAALGDTLFAAKSLGEALRQDFSPSAHIFVRLRMWHPILAGVLGSYVIGVAIAALLSPQRTPAAKRVAYSLVVATLAQAALGGINVVLMAPVWMQLTHLCVADVVWILLVVFCAEVIAPVRAEILFPERAVAHQTS